MKSCTACKKKINLAATKCPYCQTVFSAEDMDTGLEEFRGNRRLKIAIFVGLVFYGLYWVTRPANMEWLATL